MIPSRIVSDLRTQLLNSVKASCQDAQLHSLAFTLRLLGSRLAAEVGLSNDLRGRIDSVYGGFPETAGLGFKLGMSESETDDLEAHFLEGLKRLRSRPLKALETLAADDIAILGIADGLARISNKVDDEEIRTCRNWLISLIDGTPEKIVWSSRARDLAGDLLDNRGRLRVSPASGEANASALEVCLREVWPLQFSQVTALYTDDYMQILATLLKHGPPGEGQLEEASAWFKAIDLLIEQTSKSLFSNKQREGEAIDLLMSVKVGLDAKAEREAKRSIWLAIAFLAAVWLTLGVLIYLLSWDVMEPWTYVVGILASSCRETLVFPLREPGQIVSINCGCLSALNQGSLLEYDVSANPHPAPGGHHVDYSLPARRGIL